MTVGLPDLVELPCSEDMISAGVTYTRRGYLSMFIAHSRVSTARLRSLCSQSIASLAIRRWLTSENVPHNLLAFAPLTNPKLHQVMIGGRSLHVFCHLISNHDLVRKYRQSLRSLLQVDLSSADLRRIAPNAVPGDLLVIVVMLANVCHSYAESVHRMNDDDHVLGVAIPPQPVWRQQRPWRSLGRLILTNPGPERIDLEINGLEADRHLVVARVTIAANQSVEISSDLYNLVCLCTESIPGSTPQAESQARKAKWLITPGTWSNLWFYEPQLLLAGWLTKGDSEQGFKSSLRDHRDRKTPRQDDFQAPFYIQDLRPIGELIRRIRHM